MNPQYWGLGVEVKLRESYRFQQLEVLKASVVLLFKKYKPLKSFVLVM